jgi:hypothetical protein
MGNVKVLTDFSSGKYSDLELTKKSTKCTDKLTGNRVFQNPAPPLEDVILTTTNYIASLVKAENGSKEDTVIKNSWRSKLESQLKDLGLYVQLTAKGDEAIIVTSGFDTNKKPSAVGPLAKPQNIIVKMGDNKGTVWISCDAIDRVGFYEIEYAEVTADGVLKWIHKTSTKRKVLIEGLTSGKEYIFKMAGAGTDPSRIWSDTTITFVI